MKPLAQDMIVCWLVPILLVSLMPVGVQTVKADSHCYDAPVHPSFEVMCECSERLEEACYPDRAIVKEEYRACEPDGEEVVLCRTERQQVGTRTPCNGSVNMGGVERCFLAVGGMTVSGAGMATPAIPVQVVGAVGFIVSTFGVFVMCGYCDMVDCAPQLDSEPIKRDVLVLGMGTCHS